MGNNGMDDTEDDGVYGIGPGWEYTGDNGTDYQVYEPRHLVIDYAKAEQRVNAAQTLVELSPEYHKILETSKARLFSKDNRQQFWVPKSCCKWLNRRWWILASFMPEDKPLFTAMCPYCGEKDCDCGKDA